MCTDLANDILHCREWDPSILSSPHKEKILDPVLRNAEEKSPPAKSLDVDIPLDRWGRVDDFINDGIVIVLDLQNNGDRALQALLLAIHVMCKPLSEAEPIYRDDCLSLGKLTEGGVLSECLTILGWTINTRLLTITLPTKKFTLWTADLRGIVKSKRFLIKSWNRSLAA